MKRTVMFLEAEDEEKALSLFIAGGHWKGHICFEAQKVDSASKEKTNERQ